MNFKVLGYIFLVVFIVIVLKWVFDSINYGEMVVFSRDKKEIVKKEIDELFGTEVERSEYIEGFWLGLLPGDDTISFKALIGVVPLGAMALGASALTFFLYFRNKSKGSSQRSKLQS